MKNINSYIRFIIPNLYFIFIGLLSYLILKYTANVFSFSDETEQLLLFGGVLAITNFSMIFWILRNYLKKRI